MSSLSRKTTHLLNALTEALSEDSRVLFAYLYGSFCEHQKGNDIDIAVYAIDSADPHLVSADLKISMGAKTGLSPDNFDIRVVNEVVDRGDIFGLIYLKEVLTTGRLLFERDPDARGDFLFRYGLRYRECEGLIQEVIG